MALAYAATESKQIIVSYPKDTPDSVIEQAMAVIKEAVSDYCILECIDYMSSQMLGWHHHS